MSLSSLFIVYSIYIRLVLHKPPEGFTALIVAITFLSGIILFFLGVIGEYVGRIYEELKARPHYIILRRAGGVRVEAPAPETADRTLEKEFLR